MTGLQAIVLADCQSASPDCNEVEDAPQPLGAIVFLALVVVLVLAGLARFSRWAWQVRQDRRRSARR